MTRQDYINKIDREKKRVEENVIKAIKTYIETCANGMPIVEEYVLTDYQAKYFKEYSLTELEMEYPFLSFTFSNLSNTIFWSLK
jgi:hypothetical protein